MSDKTTLILSKNVVLCGGTAEERQSFITQSKAMFLNSWPSAHIFTLSEHIGDSDRYLQSVRKEFPIKRSDKNKYELGHDQLNDSYMEWVHQFKSTLVVIPEVQKLYKREPDYFYQLMGDYMAAQQSLLGQCTIRFLATFNELHDIDIKKVPVLIGGDWRPSSKDLEIVAL